MILSNNGFWASLYRGARRIRHTFFRKPSWSSDPYSDKTDLCTFLRSIFVVAPLALAANAAALGALIFSLCFLGKELFENMSSVLMVLIVMVSFALVIGATIAFVIGGTSLFQTLNKSETASVLKNAVLAKKQKICPLISFTEN